MKRCLRVGIFSIFMATVFEAQALPRAEVKEALRRIETLRHTLKMTGDTDKCTDTPRVECSFQSACGDAGARSQDLYLYQDAKGHAVANTVYINMLEMSESCLKMGARVPPVKLDPFIYPEVLSARNTSISRNERQKLYAVYNAQIPRSRQIFQDAQQRILKILEARRTAGNATEINAMIEKVRTMKMLHMEAPFELEDMIEDGCESPNAFYDPVENQVTVCPQLMNYPDGGLFSVIAHEIGHGIDSCNMAIDYTDQREESEAKPVKNGNAAAGYLFAPEKNPFASVLQCLQSKGSMEVVVPSQADVKRSYEQQKEEYLKELREYEEANGKNAEQSDFEGTEAKFAEALEDLEANYHQHKHCASMTNNGHMQEAFSDWISVKAVEDKLDSMQESGPAKDFAYSTQSISLALDCKNIQAASLQRLRTAAGGTCTHLDEYEEYLAEVERLGVDSHPPAAKRVNNLILASPKIRDKMGCQPNGSHGKECS